MGNSRRRTKGKVNNAKTGRKHKRGTLTDYEVGRNCNIAANNAKLKSLNLPHMGSNVHAQERPRKIAKVTDGSHIVPSGNHNLRSRSRNNTMKNVDEEVGDDPEYQPEEDTINANEDVEEIQQGQQEKKGRGITQKLNIISRKGQAKIKIALNEFGQPVGLDSKEFATTVGTFVRKKISLSCDDWRDIDINEKLQVWDDVQTHYEIDPAGMQFVLESAHMMWKDYKAALKKTYFDASLTEEELIARRDPRVNDEQWKWLVDHWRSPEAMARSIRGKANRGKLLLLHTAGSKSNARVAHDLGVKLGHPARRDEVFVETHKRKDGEIIPVAAERVATLQDILEVYPELKEKTIQEGDLYSVAFGKKEPRGRVRVLGKGPTPQVVGTPGTRSRIPTRLQLEIEAHRQTKEELKNLNQRVDNMQQRFDSMEKIVMPQGQHNMETSSQHASNSRHESPSSQGGIEVMYNPIQQVLHGEPTLRSLDSMQLGDDDYIIRKRVVKPRIPPRTTATCSREISIDQQDNLVGRDVILYAVLRADTPVAKATVASVDPNSLVGGEPLGVEFYEVVVNVVLKRDALLPRPYGDMQNMADAQYTSIAWPSNRMKFTKISTLSKSAGRALPM